MSAVLDGAGLSRSETLLPEDEVEPVRLILMEAPSCAYHGRLAA